MIKRKFQIEENLRRIVKKLAKKDPRKYEILLKKMNEILISENPEHYKNLRKPLQHLKRVRVDKRFVLTFRYVKSEDLVIFYDFDHHDKVYK